MPEGILTAEARVFAPDHAVKQPLADLSRDVKLGRCAMALRATKQPDLVELASQLVPLRGSEASQVYRGGTLSLSRIVKVHAEPSAFTRELAGYRALAPTGLVPHVHRIITAARTLVLEDVGTDLLGSTPDDVDALAHALGYLHRAASAQPLALAVIAPRCSIGLLVHQPPPAWVVEPSAYREALDLALRLYGPSHVPVALGDLKPDHVRRRPTGELALIDLETFSPGVLGDIDVLALANFISGPAPWRHLLAHYHRGRGTTVDERTLDIAHACLDLVARATGISENVSP